VIFIKIEKINISLIKPYWRNPRYNKNVVEPLVESIKKFGFNVPLVVDKDNVIITGHSRYKALLQLDYKEIPCIVSDMSERDAKEYRIADNKISELSSWNTDLLKKEVMELKEVIGFEEDELKELLKGFEESEGVTMETYNKVDEQLNNKFNDLVEERINDNIKIMCPHCLKEFEMNKSDVLNA